MVAITLVQGITLGIAIYAAVVATLDLAWRWRSHRRRRASVVSLTTRATVEVSFVPPVGERKLISIDVRNMSTEQIRVDLYGWCEKKGRPTTSAGWGPGEELVIAPRDRGTIQEEIEHANFDLDRSSRKMVAWVQLTTGEEYWSPPIEIPHLVRAHINRDTKAEA